MLSKRQRQDLIQASWAKAQDELGLHPISAGIAKDEIGLFIEMGIEWGDEALPEDFLVEGTRVKLFQEKNLKFASFG